MSSHCRIERRPVPLETSTVNGALSRRLESKLACGEGALLDKLRIAPVEPDRDKTFRFALIEAPADNVPELECSKSVAIALGA